jgi:L-ascorbate metabolism protein UlaG (beta-lactamase superfamily)
VKPKFENLDPSVRPEVGRALKWAVVDKLAGRRRSAPKRAPVEVAQDARVGVQAEEAAWLGHSTAWISMGGVCAVTDPVFAPRLGGFIGRNVPLVVGPEAMPKVDLVLLSHNHRDHLDEPSVRALEQRFKPRYLVPTGVERYLKGWGIDPARITSLGWWEACDPVPGSSLRVTLVPAQHWSQRLPWDRNQTLWGGYVLQADGRSAYFAGDSGYFDGFQEIGRRFPKLDLAFMPIGAYEPEWFMAPQHMNPDDAGRAFLELGAARMVAIHWGTYKLTDEALDEPPQRLEDWRSRQRVEPERVLVLPVGGRLSL